MSISPHHPDPQCPACHGQGSVPFDMDEDDPRAFRKDVRRDVVSRRPCSRCKAEECSDCDAVLPQHTPDCRRDTRDDELGWNVHYQRQVAYNRLDEVRILRAELDAAWDGLERLGYRPWYERSPRRGIARPLAMLAEHLGETLSSRSAFLTEAIDARIRIERARAATVAWQDDCEDPACTTDRRCRACRVAEAVRKTLEAP